MSICSNCKSKTSRIRTHWAEDGAKFEECPKCAPSSFEKFTAPSDKKIWMGYEAHPNEYEKKYDKDGLIYERKPEYRSEQESRLATATEEERAAEERAVAEKRATRRTSPLDEMEIAAAMRKAEQIAAWIIASGGEEVN